MINYKNFDLHVEGSIKSHDNILKLKPYLDKIKN
jgi:hypothetical protein